MAPGAVVLVFSPWSSFQPSALSYQFKIPLNNQNLKERVTVIPFRMTGWEEGFWFLVLGL